MKSVLIRSRVGADGMLRLEVPSELSETDVEVVVIMQPVSAPSTRVGSNGDWSPGFFQSVVGGWEGEPLKRELEGPYEIRSKS